MQLGKCPLRTRPGKCMRSEVAQKTFGIAIVKIDKTVSCDCLPVKPDKLKETPLSHSSVGNFVLDADGLTNRIGLQM